MIQTALLIMNLFSSPVMASEQMDNCGSHADRKLKAVMQVVEFPVEFIQWGHVGRIERIGFESVTPGTINQEYRGTYRLTYKPGPFALFQEQIVDVRFSSPFICDDLKLRCLTVVSSKPSDHVDPKNILRSGPLSCNQ